ncbi:hypothetical protein ACIRPT_10375 [Streptomyces sp. NPDC101227]|uniref:hypothetical protein n=1 Tax=Streptomyces sp. NPDC101227 TaxID=3366136 RepID=UPI0037F24A3C
MVATSFGLAFVEANSATLHGPWTVVARICGGVLAVFLGVRIVAARRAAGMRFGRAGSGAFGGWYRLVVLAEVAALVAGLLVINSVAKHGSLTLPWVTFVVGVHFFGLGTLWRSRALHALAAALTVLGAAGFVLGAVDADPAWIAVVSGMLPGVALFTVAASSLVQHKRRIRDTGRAAGAAAGQSVSPHGGS